MEWFEQRFSEKCSLCLWKMDEFTTEWGWSRKLQTQSFPVHPEGKNFDWFSSWTFSCLQIDVILWCSENPPTSRSVVAKLWQLALWEQHEGWYLGAFINKRHDWWISRVTSLINKKLSRLKLKTPFVTHDFKSCWSLELASFLGSCQTT